MLYISFSFLTLFQFQYVVYRRHKILRPHNVGHRLACEHWIFVERYGRNKNKVLSEIFPNITNSSWGVWS